MSFIHAAGEHDRRPRLVRLARGAVNSTTTRHNVPTASPIGTAAPRTPTEWFNTNGFSLPPAYTFATAARNCILAPGYTDIDMAVVKDVHLRSGAQLELRWGGSTCSIGQISTRQTESSGPRISVESSAPVQPGRSISE